MKKQEFVRKLKESPRERAIRDLHKHNDAWFDHNKGWATKAWTLLKQIEESEGEIIETHFALGEFLQEVDPSEEYAE